METFQDAVGQFDFQAVVRSTVDFQASRKRPHPATQYVGPGDSIAADPDVLRGHGTFLANERLVGAVCAGHASLPDIFSIYRLSCTRGQWRNPVDGPR